MALHRLNSNERAAYGMKGPPPPSATSNPLPFDPTKFFQAASAQAGAAVNGKPVGAAPAMATAKPTDTPPNFPYDPAKMFDAVNNRVGSVVAGKPNNDPLPFNDPTPTTPTREKSPVVPPQPDTSGATEAARAQVAQSLATGTALGNKLFAPGTFGRVDVPRQEETKALISAQEGRLGGMTPQEQEAARENALLQINQQANARLRTIGNQAAGHGLRGGVVAGEQAQVASGAQAAYGSALQDLMARAQKSQVDASSQLGNTLSAARGLEQGAQDININAATGELQGRLSTPFNYGNAIDAATTADRIEQHAETGRLEKANDITQQLEEADRNRDEILEKAEDDKLKTGDHYIDDAPQNVLARAYGVSRFEDLPPGVKTELISMVPSNNPGQGATAEDFYRWLNDPKNKDALGTLIAKAKERRRNGGK